MLGLPTEHNNPNDYDRIQIIRELIDVKNGNSYTPFSMIAIWKTLLVIHVHINCNTMFI